MLLLAHSLPLQLCRCFAALGLLIAAGLRLLVCCFCCCFVAGLLLVAAGPLVCYWFWFAARLCLFRPQRPPFLGPPPHPSRSGRQRELIPKERFVVLQQEALWPSLSQ